MKKDAIPEIYVMPYRVNSAEINMATDRYLLGVPGTFLRLYGWERPTLSFGRLHKGVGDIDLDYCQEKGIHMVKRLSGGKTVLHQHELTYGFISDTDRFPDSVVDTYRVISRILSNSFSRFGLQAEMSADKDDSTDSTICFRETSAFELTVNSRKLVGSAQYRKRKRFFQHGSILLDIDWQAWKRIWKLPEDSKMLEERITSMYTELKRQIEAADLATIISEEFGRYFGSELLEFVPGPADQSEIDELSRKYIWEQPGK